MKFNGKTDIDAPLNASFEAFADFEAFERMARRSGASVARTDDLTTPGLGMMWDIQADFRGKTRKIKAELVDYEPPNSLDFSAVASGFEATIKVELTPLTARRTRAFVTLEVTPKSLTGRVALHSARLAKGRLTKKFRSRLHHFGKTLEERIQSA